MRSEDRFILNVLEEARLQKRELGAGDVASEVMLHAREPELRNLSWEDIQKRVQAMVDEGVLEWTSEHTIRKRAVGARSPLSL